MSIRWISPSDWLGSSKGCRKDDLDSTYGLLALVRLCGLSSPGGFTDGKRTSTPTTRTRIASSRIRPSSTPVASWVETEGSEYPPSALLRNPRRTHKRLIGKGPQPPEDCSWDSHRRGGNAASNADIAISEESALMARPWVGQSCTREVNSCVSMMSDLDPDLSANLATPCRSSHSIPAGVERH